MIQQAKQQMTEKEDAFWQRYRARQAVAASQGGFPKMREGMAIASVALTSVIMAYSGLMGLLPILVMYAIWLPRAFFKGRLILRPSGALFLPVSLAVLAVFSTLWSDYPIVTLRASLEYASMLVCTFLMARLVTVEAFIKGLSLGALLVLLALFGGGGFSFDGLFGSKNQVGLFAEVGLYAAIIYAFTKVRVKSKFVFSFIPAAICIPCLFLCHSAGAASSFVLTIGSVMVLYLITKFSPRVRPVIVLVALVAAFFCVIVLFFGNLDLLVYKAMGKDATLTGRSELWHDGIQVGLMDPFFGHGYHAFWTPGNPLADLYWYQSHVPIGGGFHFHNLFIQTFVDMGGLGALLIALLIFASFYKSLRYALRNGITLMSATCFGFAFMFLVRSFVEVDFLGPFGIGLFIVYSLLPRLAEEKRADFTAPNIPSVATL